MYSYSAKKIFTLLVCVFALLLLISTPLSASAHSDWRWHKPTPTPQLTKTKTPAMTPTAQIQTPISTQVSSSSLLKVGAKFQYQLQGTFSLISGVQIYDVDGFDTPMQTVQTIHASGAVAVCYIDAGTYENWRLDEALFPPFVKGSSNGWPGEAWLDIRQISILLPIIEARIAMCSSKGFDAVELDNVDGYTNKTGFSLTAQDQLQFNKVLSELAHKHNLLAVLKNDPDQASQLVSSFDAVLDEQCFQYSECSSFSSFVAAKKPVFTVEYKSCPSTIPNGFSVIHKNTSLDSYVQFCN